MIVQSIHARQLTFPLQLKSIGDDIVIIDASFKSLQNAVAPISVLPSDIFLQVFSYLRQTNVGADVMRLLRVCKYWKDMTYEFGSLWSSASNYVMGSNYAIPRCLERAGGSPLDLILRVVMGKPEDDIHEGQTAECIDHKFFRRVACQTDQLRSIQLIGGKTWSPPGQTQAAFECLLRTFSSRPAAQLRTLTLDCHNPPHTVAIPDDLFGACAPSLRRFTLKMPVHNLPLHLTTNLTHLHLHDTVLPLDVFLDHLKLNPQLEILLWTSPREELLQQPSQGTSFMPQMVRLKRLKYCLFDYHSADEFLRYRQLLGYLVLGEQTSRALRACVDANAPDAASLGTQSFWIAPLYWPGAPVQSRQDLVFTFGVDPMRRHDKESRILDPSLRI